MNLLISQQCYSGVDAGEGLENLFTVVVMVCRNYDTLSAVLTSHKNNTSNN